MSELTAQISHEELVHAWAPLVDVSMALDKIRENAGAGNAGEII